MKSYKTISYTFLVLFLVLGIAFGFYKAISANDGKSNKVKEKAKTEIEYLDGKIMKLFNEMNQIQFENYKISVNKVDTSDSKNSSASSQGGGSQSKSDSSGSSKEGSGSGEGSSSGESSGGSSGSSSGNSQGESSQSKGSSGSQSEKSESTYTLQETSVLTKSEDIDWIKVKNEVENIYLSLPTITLDLYQTDINDQDILLFNTEYDNLTKTIQQEEKVATLQQLVKLYEIITRFTDGVSDDAKDKKISKAKLDIYKAYSKLDDGKWEEISNDTKAAVDEISKLMTSTDMKDQKQYSTNKLYVMISELQKAADIKDEKIFLIKYKNTLEELINI